jgi:tetratricopeptide (TPR) repeat protein
MPVSRVLAVRMIVLLGVLQSSVLLRHQLQAVETNGFGFFGVAPGVTTEAELLKNSIWGQPDHTEAKDGQRSVLTYKFSVWQKLTVEIRDGVVQAIDVRPPDRTRAALLAEKLGLGELNAVADAAALPKSVLNGPEDVSGLRILTCSKASNIFLFADESLGAVYVKLMRIVPARSIAVTHTPAAALAEPGITPMSFLGVTPGQTTADGLLGLPEWGPPLHKAPLSGDASLLTYTMPEWPEITLTEEAGIIWTIDAVPPEWTDPDRLASKLGLGQKTVEAGAKQSGTVAPSEASEKPAWARLAPVSPASASVASYPDSMAVMFVAEHKGQRVAERIRLYADVPERFAYFGIQMQTLSKDLARRLGLPSDAGILVTAVAPSTPASRAAIDPGDVLLKIDDLDLENPARLLEILHHTTPGKTRGLLIRRGKDLIMRRVTFGLPKLKDAFLIRASEARRDGDFHKAIHDISQILRVDPHDANAYSARGECLLKLGMWKQAEKDFTTALQITPNSVRSYVGRGDGYIQLKQFDAAIADLTQAIKLDATVTQAYTDRARALLQKGDYPAALADASEAIRQTPEDAWPYLVRGVIETEQQSYDDALKDYNKALELSPKLILAYKNRAVLYQRRGQKSLAEADYKKAAELERLTSGGGQTATDSRAQSPSILDIDRQLQSESPDKRTAQIELYLASAGAALKKGQTRDAAAFYWSARQLEVVKTVPTASWIHFDMEVTDETLEMARFKSLIAAFNDDDQDSYFAGVRVLRVLPGGQAAKAGLFAGVQIVEIGKTPVSTASQCQELFQTFVTPEGRPGGNKSDQKLLLKVRNFDGAQQFILLRSSPP